MRVLDLCCGFGGWSIGFWRAGFDCTGVDIVDIGYPYRLVLEDIREFHPQEHYDVVVASPPCTEFSDVLFLPVSRGFRAPGDPEKGMELVRECLRVIWEAQPRFWVIENVRGAVKHISAFLGQEPKVIHKPWFLWGEMPEFLLGQSNLGFKTRKVDGRLNADVKFDPLTSWKRARIPLPLSVALAGACKNALQEVHA